MEERTRALENLKTAITTPPILAFPDLNKGYTLYADASGYGVGAILEQRDDKGVSRVICYASRSLSRAERRYSPTHLEALAIVWAVKKFRPYIYGRHVKIVTDHKALEFLICAKDSTGQLYQWSIQFQ
jgi:hypothetical protein